MDNSLLAVRDINHKYIVVERGKVMLDNILASKTVTFQDTNIPVPYSYRMYYRYAQITLIIGKCSSRNAVSWTKLQMLSSALNYETEYNNLLVFLNDTKEYIPYIKFEPALKRAVTFMQADNLIEFNSNIKLSLTEQGKRFLAELMENTTIMISDKEKINEIGKRLTESIVDGLVSAWRLYHV